MHSCRQHTESEVDMKEAKQMAVIFYRIKVGPNRNQTGVKIDPIDSSTYIKH